MDFLKTLAKVLLTIWAIVPFSYVITLLFWIVVMWGIAIFSGCSLATQGQECANISDEAKSTLTILLNIGIGVGIISGLVLIWLTRNSKLWSLFLIGLVFLIMSPFIWILVTDLRLV